MMLYFIKCFFFIYWQDHMVIILSFINVMYHIDWFVNIEPACSPGMNPTWSGWIILFICCWIRIASILHVNFCIHIHQGYWPVVLFFCWVSVWFGNQVNGRFIEWVLKLSLSLYFLHKLSIVFSIQIFYIFG